MRQDAVWCCMQEGARREAMGQSALFDLYLFHVYCLNLLRIRTHIRDTGVYGIHTPCNQSVPHHHNMYMFPITEPFTCAHHPPPRRRATMRRGGERHARRRAIEEQPSAHQSQRNALPAPGPIMAFLSVAPAAAYSCTDSCKCLNKNPSVMTSASCTNFDACW